MVVERIGALQFQLGANRVAALEQRAAQQRTHFAGFWILLDRVFQLDHRGLRVVLVEIRFGRREQPLFAVVSAGRQKNRRCRDREPPAVHRNHHVLR